MKVVSMCKKFYCLYFQGSTDAGTKKLMSDAISDNLGVGTSTSCHGKPAALGKPAEPADTGTCDVPNVDDFNDFVCDDFIPNETRMGLS